MTPRRMLVLAAAAVLPLLAATVDRLLAPERRAAWRALTGACGFGLLLAAAQRFFVHGVIWVDVLRGWLAACALAAVLYERRRAASGRPPPRAMVRRAALGLAAAAGVSWYAGAVYGWTGGIHVWDQYHYFVGSRYFRELGYDGLYRCAAVAQSELAAWSERHGATPLRVDPAAEVRAPGVMLRNLGVDNGLIPATTALARADACRARFTPARWGQFRADVAWFRRAAGARDWALMQRDHGYNPSPLWTLLGGSLARLHPASLRWLQLLALLDPLLLLAAFVLLLHSFGWRSAALAAVFWGTQAFSSFFWTGGAFLRQDWLFLLVLALCLTRRRHHLGAGAAWAAAALLRVFPVLLAAGWLVQAGWALRHGRVPRAQLRIALGALLATAVLVPASAAVSGVDAWPAFVRHLRLHERTPLSNQVGLRPALAALPLEPGSPRMARQLHAGEGDAFARWKADRERREARTRPLFWAVVVLGAALFVRGMRRVRRPWQALPLSLPWLVLLPQLTCYYYSFLALAAPLARRRTQLEPGLLALAAASQLAWAISPWFDDRALLLGLLALGWCAWLWVPALGRPAASPHGRSPAANG